MNLRGTNRRLKKRENKEGKSEAKWQATRFYFVSLNLKNYCEKLP